MNYKYSTILTWIVIKPAVRPYNWNPVMYWLIRNSLFKIRYWLLGDTVEVVGLAIVVGIT